MNDFFSSKKANENKESSEPSFLIKWRICSALSIVPTRSAQEQRIQMFAVLLQKKVSSQGLSINEVRSTLATRSDISVVDGQLHNTKDKALRCTTEMVPWLREYN